ncbi:MAG: helix-turn-helix domain-containing protein [Pseudolabrys sp.]
MGGQSLTATELAYCANVSRSTASGHLSKLVAARLLTVTRKRRFSYYRIASPLVATMLESIKVVAAIEATPPSAAVSKRRCTPFCPKLLRPPGRPGRSRCYRFTCGLGAHRTHR